MEVLRRVVNLNNLKAMVDIPSTFDYQQVEILILPIETETEVFEPEKFFGVSHIENIEQAIQEMRDEWD